MRARVPVDQPLRSNLSPRGQGGCKAASRLRSPVPSDLVALADHYPAAALLLSLKRQGCSFSRLFEGSLVADSAKSYVVLERCQDPLYPSGSFEMRWTFDPSSYLPTQVSVPLPTNAPTLTPRETIEFTSFTTVDGLRTPSTITVIRPSGHKVVLTVSDYSFTTALPDSLFTDH